MNEILFHYEKIAPTTWVYLSSLLIIGLFFKFGRFWSVRNLDLLLLILLAPGMLLVSEGQEVQRSALAAVAAALEKNDVPEQNDAPKPDQQVLPEATSENSDEPESADEPEETRPATGQRNGKKVRTDEDADEDRQVETALTPAQRTLRQGQTIQRIGFTWLLLAGVLLLIRLLVDPTMVRRPLLEPNMTTGGVTFSCCSLFVFLMANVVASRPTADDLAGPISAERMMTRQASDDLDRHGPGYALVFALPSLPTVRMGTRSQVDDPSVTIRSWKYRVDEQSPYIAVDAAFEDIASDEMVKLKRRDDTELSIAWGNLSEDDQAFVRKVRAYTTIAKLVAILSHLAIVVGIIAIGYWHFQNVKMGIGAATLYLMLPYTSQMTGRVDHALPAAFLVWALLTYRRPLVSGIFMGLAIGVIYYPLFLLPLWISFYWRRGLLRFSVGLVTVLTIMVITLAFISTDAEAFWQCIKKMFGLTRPQTEGLGGIWGLGWEPVYRYPVLAAFVALCGSLAIWPAQKNLGTLLSCSAAIMVATQFWHGHGGGLYMAWYLPPLLLTVFRPNLEDRTALSVVHENWLPQKWTTGA
jgi:hypothetical protein